MSLKKAFKDRNLQKSQQRNEDLEKRGYTSLEYRAGQSTTGGYEERLLEVLQGAGVSHIDEIPTYRQKSATTTTALVIAKEIFSSFSVDVHEQQDVYETSILALLAKYETQIEYRNLTDAEYVEIFKLFMLGHIKNLDLYYRFEKLKRQEKIYYYRRMFNYGLEIAREGYSPDAIPEEKKVLYDFSLDFIYYALRSERITQADIEPDAHKFHEKIKVAYIATLHRKMGTPYRLDRITSLSPDAEDIFDTLPPEEQEDIKNQMKDWAYVGRPGYREGMLPGERNPIVEITRQEIPLMLFAEYIEDEEKKKIKYDVLRPHNMQEVFRFSREELHQLNNQAKKTFVFRFIEFCKNLTADGWYDFEDFPISYNHIGEILESVKKAAPAYGIPEEEVEGLREVMRQRLTIIIGEEIGKILRKEVIPHRVKDRNTRFVTRKRGQMRGQLYTPQMNVVALENLGFADDEVVKDWHKNKDVYADEVEDKVVNDFLVKRKANVITKNKLQVEDIDTVRSQIVEQATQKLIAAYQKKTFQSKSTFDFTTISSGGMNKLLNESVLFSVGYFTLVKSLISGDKTRKIFWKEVRKEIAYNVLIDAKNKLMDLKTVEHHAFYALPGLLGLFKKYGGKLGDVKLQNTVIENNYYEYLTSHIGSDLKHYTDSIERYVQGKGKKSAAQIYDYFFVIEEYLHSSIQNYLRSHMTKEEIQKFNDDIYTDHFAINEEQYGHHYPGSYLLSISRMRYSANQVEEKIPQNILEPIIEAFRKEENLQKRFFKIVVDERMSKNALPGGKLQRIISDQLANVASVEDARKIIVDYVLNNLDELVIRDLKYTLIDIKEVGGLMFNEKAIIKECVKNVLAQWAQKLGQKGLGGDGSIHLLEQPK